MQPSQASNETRLPRAVLRRSAALQERIEARNKPPESDTPNPADLAAAAATPAATPATPADTPPATPHADPRDTDPAYWKQRFSVTEGILRRERDDRATENRSLHQRVNELQGQIDALKSQAPTTEKVDLTLFFTPEQIERYGEEQCQAMAATAMKAADATAKKLIDAAVQPLKQERDRQQQQTAKSAKDDFIDKLTELYPTWQTDDVDPRWLAWLQEFDENDVQRQAILDACTAVGNAKGCAKLFKAWAKSVEAAAPAPAPAPKPPITPSGSGAAPGPGDAPNVPDTPASAKGYPSQADIRDYYKRAKLSKVKDAERTEFEARLALRNAA